MKKILKIIGIVLLFVIIGGAWFAFNPVDIKPDYFDGKIAEADKAKGKALLDDMQTAYGGKENWLAHKTGSFAQVADWYEDKLGLSGWDVMPQEIQITSVLGTEDSKLNLLNGPNTDKTWDLEDYKFYETIANGQKVEANDHSFKTKLDFKNYWFQFPFRIVEAPIVAYAGEGEVQGENYDLVYATWGNEDANREYHQYILYLDKETRLVEWLHFTIRDKLKFLHSTAQFTDLRTINGIVAPFNQFITRGAPEDDGPKFHENRYQWIEFGDQRVER